MNPKNHHIAAPSSGSIRRRIRSLLLGAAVLAASATALGTATAPAATAMPISEWQDQCNSYTNGVVAWYRTAGGFECLWKGATGWTRDYYSRDGRFLGTCAGTYPYSHARRSCIF